MVLPNTSPIPIRPHHGMCLAYFEGKGYSDNFSSHMQEMLELFLESVPVRLVIDMDNICSACPNNLTGICTSQEHVIKYDQKVLSLCHLSEGQVLDFMDFARLVQENILSPGKRKQICGGCQWESICSSKNSRWEQKTL